MKMTRSIHMFLVIIAIFSLEEHQIVLVSAASCPKRKEFGSAVIDKVLVGPVLNSFTSNGEVVCQFNCHANDNCDKYNFNSYTNQCEILRKHPTYIIEEKAGWMFKTIKCEVNPCNGFLCYENEGPACICTYKWMGKHCNVHSQALGMEDKTIPDSQITASSYYGSGHEPYRGRLNKHPILPYYTNVDSGAWAIGSGQAGPKYLQIDLGRVVCVTMVATQGRPYRYDQWVTKYKISYRDESDSTLWKEYKEDGIVKQFPGNSDMETVVQHHLGEGIRTQIIRVIALQWNIHVSMRVEVYGVPSIA